jgi:tRNA(fMet)-specific endonuclease VapC
VVLGELYYGAEYGDPKYRGTNLALIAQVRQEFASLPFDDRAAEEYGLIRAHLTKAGTPIGPNDMKIASIARANGLILVTHNSVELSRVPGLLLEDWQ